MAMIIGPYGRIKRQSLISELESMREGFIWAVVFSIENKDKVREISFRAHHFNANRCIVELGGESVLLPDFESAIEKQTT